MPRRSSLRFASTLSTVMVFTLATKLETSFAQAPDAFQFVSVRKAPLAPCPTGPNGSDLCIGTSVLSLRTPASLSVLPGGRFEARGQTLETLARVAYGFEGIDPRRGVVDLRPGAWLTLDRFDITALADENWPATPSGEVVPARLRSMLRTLPRRSARSP